jgi:hypothetical protein
MAAGRTTPGMLQRQEWKQPWTERVPTELLILGKVCLEIVRQALWDPKLRHDTSTDWESQYKNSSATSMAGLFSKLAPDQSNYPTTPTDKSDPGWDEWVKEVARSIVRLESETQSCSPRMQAELTEYAREHVSGLRTEIRACLDTVAALVQFQTHPTILIDKARTGDLNALEQLLQINPLLEAQPWARERLADLVRARGFAGSERWRLAISDGLQIRKSKLLEIGCILTLLWFMLCRLTTDQRRGFLKALGMTGVPKKKALREFERRLEVKKKMEQ